MPFKTMIMFYLLGFIGLTLIVISGILGIKACIIEIMKQYYLFIINNIHQTRIILKITYFLVYAIVSFYHFFAFKYSTAHCKYDIIVHHKRESVTSFMHTCKCHVLTYTWTRKTQFLLNFIL